ncbi:PREDICTED: ATP-dependent DNA helicase Q1-like [Amphimedon queenslandica]|nr:PREDICTED: ATP-dependent DNA helicase Q1-like [Amphimedon queenslandica]|eukprot:XP_003391313.1 PREDICTED: ATP-dependent DNA helicase Q1-like [Amphimedon queenslandica]
MALTATATKATRKEVMRILGMRNAVLVTKSPDKPNIYYSVSEKNESIDDTFEPLIQELRTSRLQTVKTIIFCRTYQDCSYLYLLFKSSLGTEFTNPIGAPDYSPFRMIDMFTACNTPSLKKKILHSFSYPNGQLRIVIATIAFGMGIDCPDVHRIIHWGPPSDLESYIQETGRAGRDGNSAVAELYFSRRDIGQCYVEETMKAYCKNDSQCRRAVLFNDFDCGDLPAKPVPDCVCCDICAMVCTCTSCKFPSPS